MIPWKCEELYYLNIKSHDFYAYSIAEKLNTHFESKGIKIILLRLGYNTIYKFEPIITYCILINGRDEAHRLSVTPNMNIDEYIDSIINSIELQQKI